MKKLLAVLVALMVLTASCALAERILNWNEVNGET